MIPRPETLITRREFIRDLGRIAAVGAVAGGGILLARKSASRGCDESTPCRSCKLLGRCGLPAAQTALKQQRNG